MIHTVPFLAALALPLAAGAEAAEAARVLFDFEGPDQLAAWSALDLDPGPGGAKEPPPSLAIEDDSAAGGGKSLRITFPGGTWPAAVTRRVPADWGPYRTFRAEVVASRPCLIGFTVLEEKSSAHAASGMSRVMPTAGLCRVSRGSDWPSGLVLAF